MVTRIDGITGRATILPEPESDDQPALPVVVAVVPPGPHPGAVVWAAVRVCLALPFFGPAWVLAAAVGLVVAGLRAGWRDAQDVAGGD